MTLCPYKEKLPGVPIGKAPWGAELVQVQRAFPSHTRGKTLSERSPYPPGVSTCLTVLSLPFMGSGGRWRRPLALKLLQEKALGRKISLEL